MLANPIQRMNRVLWMFDPIVLLPVVETEAIQGFSENCNVFDVYVSRCGSGLTLLGHVLVSQQGLHFQLFGFVSSLGVEKSSSSMIIDAYVKLARTAEMSWFRRPRRGPRRFSSSPLNEIRVQIDERWAQIMLWDLDLQPPMLYAYVAW